MEKNTIFMVFIFLLVGVIVGMTVGNKVSPGQITGKITYAGVQPDVIEIGKLDLSQLNKIVLHEDNVICYIKLGQGAGLSCVPMQK